MHIDERAIIGPSVRLGHDARVGPFTVVGQKHRSNWQSGENPQPTELDNDVVIGAHCAIYEGVSLGAGVICNDYVSVGVGSYIGADTKLQYRAQISKRVRIGTNCRIGGFVCDDTVIGDDTSFYGSAVHRYEEHGGGADVGSPRVGHDVVVGFGAVIIGDVQIGDRSYVAAGAIVSKHVPPDAVVRNVNQVYPIKDWPGRLRREDGGGPA